MNTTTNMPDPLPKHKRSDASEIGAVPCEKLPAGEPRQGQGGRDAGGMLTTQTSAKRAPTRRERADRIYEQAQAEWIAGWKESNRSLFEWHASKLDSDLERVFLAAAWFLPDDYGIAGPVVNLLPDILIEPQKKVGPYTIDFAFTHRAGAWFGGMQEIRVGVECDGAYFHDRKAKQVERDRARDRFLSINGWRIIRFSEAEIMKDARGCVAQVQELIYSLAREQVQHDIYGLDEVQQ